VAVVEEAYLQVVQIQAEELVDQVLLFLNIQTHTQLLLVQV
jgi:hypothetical protein